jgi:8-hydroxy-5-deazaflavin:NADPH oxidoreductase
MTIAVIGTGFVGGTLGRAMASSGLPVLFGSRHPEDDDVAGTTSAGVTTVGDAVRSAETVVLALPAAGVPALADASGGALGGKLVVDATNRMGAPTANSRSALPDTVRYARAFNTLGGENMADPVFAEGTADMFFSAPEADRRSVETMIGAVGLRPVYLGPDQEDLLDCLFKLWIDLAITQGRGRRLAFRLLEG